MYVQTASGTAIILGDIARNVEMNIMQGIPPGLFYDLEATRRENTYLRKMLAEGGSQRGNRRAEDSGAD